GSYEIPNQRGLQPGLGLNVNGVTDFASEDLDENQRELAQYGILAWQHSQGALDFQTALSVRYTSLHFSPDLVGDLLYNGIAQDALKDDTAFAWQTDLSYHLGTSHVVRTGFYLQHDKAESMTTSHVLPIDMNNVQTSTVPLVIPDNLSST